MESASIRKAVGILIFDDVEVLDFCGPFEVFSVVRMREEDRREGFSPYEVFLVAQNSGLVTARGGLCVMPHNSLADCPPLDVLVVPGGWGTRREMHNEVLLAWVRERSLQVSTLTSVCTGALVLASAGLLEGKRATTHWQALDLMSDSFPGVNVVRDEHVVEDGHIFTSAGISAGIDMALRVVSRDLGEEIGRATAKYMEYPFPEDNRRRI